MTVHSLFPAYGLLQYHSAYGSHVAIIPTREWNPVPLVPLALLGSYTNWSGFPCDGEEMWDEYVENYLAFFNANCFVDTLTVYTLEDEDAPAIPRALKAYGDPGTSSEIAWDKAVARTWNMRDSEYNVAKITMLDAEAAGGFDKITNISGSVPSVAFFGTVSSPSWAFASRAGFKPTVLQSVTTDLNDKLRKEYGMG